MLPIVELHAALFRHCCQTEGSLGRSVGTLCVLRAAPPEPASPLANEPSRNWLVPPSKGLLPPKQMGTNVSVPGSKHAHQVGAPIEILVSQTWRHLIQTERHTAGYVRCWEGIALLSNFGIQFTKESQTWKSEIRRERAERKHHRALKFWLVVSVDLEGDAFSFQVEFRFETCL